MLLQEEDTQHRKGLTKTRTKGHCLQWGIQNYRYLWAGQSNRHLPASGRCNEAIDSFPSYLLRLGISRTDRDRRYRKNLRPPGVKSEPHRCSVGYLNQIYHFWLNWYPPAYKLALKISSLHLPNVNQQPDYVVVLQQICQLQTAQSFHFLFLCVAICPLGEEPVISKFCFLVTVETQQRLSSNGIEF